MATSINDTEPHVRLSTNNTWQYRVGEGRWEGIDNNTLADTVDRGTQEVKLSIDTAKSNPVPVTVASDGFTVTPEGESDLDNDFKNWNITLEDEPSYGNSVTVTPTGTQIPVLTLTISMRGD